MTKPYQCLYSRHRSQPSSKAGTTVAPKGRHNAFSTGRHLLLLSLPLSGPQQWPPPRLRFNPVLVLSLRVSFQSVCLIPMVLFKVLQGLLVALKINSNSPASLQGPCQDGLCSLNCHVDSSPSCSLWKLPNGLCCSSV